MNLKLYSATCYVNLISVGRSEETRNAPINFQEAEQIAQIRANSPSADPPLWMECHSPDGLSQMSSYPFVPGLHY